MMKREFRERGEIHQTRTNRQNLSNYGEVDIPGACDEGAKAARWLIATGAVLLIAPPLVFIPILRVASHTSNALNKLGW